MAVIEIKALEKLALTHMRQRAWDYFTFQRRMLRKVNKPIYNKWQMTVLIRNFYSSSLNTVSVEITIKIKTVKSRTGRMKYFIYLFCHKVPEIMEVLQVPKNVVVKSFKDYSTACFKAQVNPCWTYE